MHVRHGPGSNQYMARGSSRTEPSGSRLGLVAAVMSDAGQVDVGGGFDPEEIRALDDNAVRPEEWPVLRPVIRRVTDDTARLWQNIRRRLPLDAAREAVDHGFVTLDELSLLAQFPGGRPVFDGYPDGWRHARDLRDGACLRVGWVGAGDHTVRFEDTDYAVIDFETTGLNPYTERVIEVAVIRLSGDGTETDRWSTLIDPQHPVGEVDVHGITEPMLRNAPTWTETEPELRRRLDGAILVAHNCTFEEHFLATESVRGGTPIGQIAALDTKRLAGQTWDDLPNRTLRSVCDHLGITNPDAHRALSDTAATADVLRRVIDVWRSRNETSFGFRIPAPTVGLSPDH